MTRNDAEDHRDEFSLEPSVREELGLPPLRSEAGAPPADTELLRTFLGDSPMNEDDQRRVMDCLDRYQEWRDEYARIVVEEYKRIKSDSSSPGFSSPE